MIDLRRGLPAGFTLTVTNAEKGILRYTILNEIGRGASGIVYEAYYVTNTGDRRKVRLKECMPFSLSVKRREDGSLACDDSSAFALAKEAFIRDFHLFSRLYEQDSAYDSFIDTIDLYEAGGTVYLASSYGPGTVLSGMNLTSLRQCLTILANTAYALDQLHQAGFLYLDLKPENILVSQGQNVQVRLFDFDSLVPADHPSSAERICFSEGYAPLEVRLGDRKRLAPQADVYSIGAVLFRILFQRAPQAEDCRRNASYDFDQMRWAEDGISDRLKKDLTSFFHRTLASYYLDRYDAMTPVRQHLLSLSALADPCRSYVYDSALEKSLFVARDAEFQQLNAWLDEQGNRTLTICGHAGIGKSALVQAFLLSRRSEISSLLYLHFNESLIHTIADDVHAGIHGTSRYPEESEEEYYQRKTEVLRRIAEQGKAVLVIDDCPGNVSVPNIGWKTIMITRSSESNGLILTKLKEEDSRKLFETISEADDEALWQRVKEAACEDPFTCCLLARALKEGKLHESGKLTRDNLLLYRSRLLGDHQLSKEEDAFLTVLNVFADQPVSLYLMEDMTGCTFPPELAEDGWVKREGGRIYISPLIREYLNSRTVSDNARCIMHAFYERAADYLRHIPSEATANLPFCFLEMTALRKVSEEKMRESREVLSLAERAVHFGLSHGDDEAVQPLLLEIIIHLSIRDRDRILSLGTQYLNSLKPKRYAAGVMVADLLADLYESEGDMALSEGIIAQMDVEAGNTQDPFVPGLIAYMHAGHLDSCLNGDYAPVDKENRRILHQMRAWMDRGIRETSKSQSRECHQMNAVLRLLRADIALRNRQCQGVEKRHWNMILQAQCRNDLLQGEKAAAMLGDPAHPLSINALLVRGWYETILNRDGKRSEDIIEKLLERAESSPLSPLDRIDTFLIPAADMARELENFDLSIRILEEGLQLCTKDSSLYVYQKKAEDLSRYIEEVMRLKHMSDENQN